MLWCVQVRLRDDASVSQQNQRHEAVGAALDQELPVWRSVEEDPFHSQLTAPPSTEAGVDATDHTPV